MAINSKFGYIFTFSLNENSALVTAYHDAVDSISKIGRGTRRNFQSITP